MPGTPLFIFENSFGDSSIVSRGKGYALVWYRTALALPVFAVMTRGLLISMYGMDVWSATLKCLKSLGCEEVGVDTVF